MMRIDRYIAVSLFCVFLTRTAVANSLIEVNKIYVSDKYLLIHANYSVLSKKDSGGSMDLTFIDQSGVATEIRSADCSRELNKINRDNQLLNPKAKNFYIGARSINALWLINTTTNIQDSVCAKESVFEVRGRHYETEYNKWVGAASYTESFKADIASTEEISRFFSMNPSITPPSETMNFTEVFEGKGFIGLTYYYFLFSKSDASPEIPDSANLVCIRNDSKKAVSLTWPLSSVSQAQERFHGKQVSIIPLIVPPNEDAFKDMLRCDVSFDIVKSSSSIDGHEIYPVRYSVEFGEEHLGH